MSKTLKQIIEEKALKQIIEEKVYEEGYDDFEKCWIIEIVKEWLTQKGNQYDQKYEETENEHYVGAKYAIRELLEELNQL